MSSQQSGSKEILNTENIVNETVSLIQGSYKNGRKKKIGIEVELPFVDTEELKPIPFSGPKSISAVFNALCAQEVWQPDGVEDGKITSLTNESGMITLEPGGQIEFASAARATLGQIKLDIENYVGACKSVSGQIGVDVVPFGFHPHISIEECPYIYERSRFMALKAVFEAERGYAAWGQSASVQVTLDSPSVEQSFDAFKLGLLLQPLAAAMFANSPFAQGQDSGYQSWRRHNLLSIESPLYKTPDALFDPDFGIEQWAEYVLNMPMSFVVRDGQYVEVAKKPFKDMIGKPLPELAGLPESEQYLSKTDLLDHLTGIKPEMLLKPNLLLEFRAADLGPSPQHWLGVAAFWVGIFYDPAAFKAAQDYVAGWSREERTALREGVAKDGLKTKIGGMTAQTVILDLLDISKQGLERIEPEAASLLAPLFAEVGAGKTSADKALEAFIQAGSDITATLKQSFLFAPQKAPSRSLA